jgi:YD repeat-containing protein
MSGGQALKLRLELAQLAQRHCVIPTLSRAMPLAAPASRPVLISGIAAANTIDQERMKFRPWSLTFLPWKPPPLLFRHHEPAGEILKLAYDARGRLLVEARVDHPEARRCQGLSVAATIERYELREQDDPERFHALILQAQLDEISLTPTPACADCVVTSRLPANPANETFDLAARGIGKAIEIVELLRQQFNAQPAAQPPRHPRAVAPRPRTEFSKLVAAMEERFQ